MFLTLIALLSSLLLIHTAAFPQDSADQWQYGNAPQSPDYPWLFEHPLPIPPEAKPLLTETINGRKIHYFELTIETFDVQVYPNLGPAHFVGYSKEFA